MNVELVLLNEDWFAIYVDGELKIQGHSLDVYDTLFALGIKYKYREVQDERLDRLPKKLEKLK